MQKHPQDDVEDAGKSESSELAELAEFSDLQGPKDTDDGKVYVYMDFKVDHDKVGRIVIELYKRIAPKACENFRQLCCRAPGVGATGKPLWYKGSFIHKVFPSFMVQGGDITNFDGSGGESIHGPVFEDESFDLKLDAGVLGMVSNGEKNSNSSQFFISCVDFPHLQGSHVAFGRVKKGFHVVDEISNIPNTENTPLKKIVIDDCGELSANSEEWNYWEDDGPDQYPPYPEDWEPKEDISSENWVKEVTKAVTNIKNRGNHYFSHQKYDMAMRKYNKALRYLTWIKGVKEDVYNKCIDLSIACLSNLAKTNLCNENFRQAHQQCSEVLQMKPDAKAYFRRGQANFGLHNYDAALKDLNKAQELEPCDRVILKEIRQVKIARKQSKFEEKQRFANLLK